MPRPGVRPRLLPPPYHVGLRDIASRDGTTDHRLPLEIQSREENRFRVITPSEEDASSLVLELGRRNLTSSGSAIRRSMLAISQSTLSYRAQDGDREFALGQFEAKSRGGYAKVYGGERSSCHGKWSYICWDTIERGSRQSRNASLRSESPFAR